MNVILNHKNTWIIVVKNAWNNLFSS